MDPSSHAVDPVNINDPDPDRGPPTSRDPGSLFVPAGRRHAIPRRVTRGNASPTEMLHHLLGAHASNTLTGALAQAHSFAELIAEHLSTERCIGTLANHLVAQLEVCLALSEELPIDDEGRAS